MSCFQLQDFINVLTVHYHAPSDDTWGENEIDHVLLVQKDVPLHINPEEVSETRYFTYEEVVQVVFPFLYSLVA